MKYITNHYTPNQRKLAHKKSIKKISVLNTDYKLYASILTKRMEELMPLLTDEDQTGFIRNRQTHDNIRRALHIIDYINIRKDSAILLSV